MDARSSGEFIVASGDSQIRVYLQHGRIAWASSSRSRYGFTKYLEEHCSVSRVTIEQAVRCCRESKLSIGAYLIQQGIVSADEVQTALREQVEAALLDLADCAADANALFLPAGENSKTYTSSTFKLSELRAAQRIGALTHLPDIGRLEDGLLPLSGFRMFALIDSEHTIIRYERNHSSDTLSQDTAAAFCAMVTEKEELLRGLGFGEQLEEIVFTYPTQYHMVARFRGSTLFLLLVLSKDTSNLAIARSAIRQAVE
ncbi:MAG: DUF4388 domain-containing protein [Myxococcota bacterium]